MRVVPLLVLALIAFPLFGQSNDVAVWAGSSRMGKTSLSGSDIHFDNGKAFGVSFTHFFSHHYAAEIAAFSLRNDGTVRVGGVSALDIGRLKIMPITATLQWHAEHSHRFDPYLGVGLAYVHGNSIQSADLDNSSIGRVEVESRVGWTALVGGSYAFMKPLAVAVEARYVGYEPQSGPSGSQVRLQLSPLIYSAGLRWRF